MHSKEEQGRNQGERYRVCGAPQLVCFTAEGNQHKGGHQHNFEPDVKIENIAGDKSSVHAHQQAVNHRKIEERLSLPVDGLKRINADAYRDDAGKQDHKGAEGVHDQGDAERGKPVPGMQYKYTFMPDPDQYENSEHQLQQRSGKTDPWLPFSPLKIDQQENNGNQRKEYRQGG
ncbi:hypothetical protein DSECCO2_563710 [anaerobic digester metagenome]